MIELIMLVAFSFVAGVLYRLGGVGKPFNTKYRDFGVPIIYMLYLLYSGIPFNVYLIASAILLFASLTTYWKCISRWIGKDIENVYWWNWLATGFFYGLTLLPMCFMEVSFSAIILRAVVLGVLTMIWSEKISDVEWEEFGRGFLIIVTLIIL